MTDTPPEPGPPAPAPGTPPEGGPGVDRITGLIAQQRARARAATRSARVLLALLVVTVLFGLGFYLGQPFFRQWVEGERVALDRSITVTETRLAELRREMESQSAAFAESLEDAFVLLDAPTRAALSGHVETSEGLVFYGDEGTRIATDPLGEEAVLIGSDSSAWLRAHVPLERGTLFYGAGGSLRTQGPKGPVLSANRDDIAGHVAMPDGWLFYGNYELWETDVAGQTRGPRTSVLRPPPQQTSLQRTPPLPSPFQRTRLIGHARVPGGVLFYGLAGRMFRRSEGQDGLMELPTASNDTLYGHVEVPNALLFYGAQGTLIRTDPKGNAPAPIYLPTTSHLQGHVMRPDGILFYGSEGALFWTETNGENPQEIETFTKANLWRHAELPDGLLIYGANGTILRTGPRGESPTRLDTPTEFVTLRGHVALPDGLLFYGDLGTLLYYGDRLAMRLRDALDATTEPVADRNGPDANLAYIAATQATLTQTRAALPSHLLDRGAEAVGIAGAIAGQAELLGQRLEGDLARQDRYRTFPYSLVWDRDLNRFGDFMATCRAGASEPAEGSTPAPLTLACLEGWEAQKAAERESWWQALAVQVPPGVLLLFLLATLGGLYRYNIRMAGFHHGRADALELLAQGVDAAGLATLEKASAAFAADAVAFGKTDALPTDQAIKLTQAIRG